MRVLQLGPVPPPHGGVQSNIVAIRNYLRKCGHGAGALNITRHKQANRDELYFPHGAFETARMITTLPYDVLHLHLGGDITSRLLALSLLCTSAPGRKSVLTFHSGGFPSSPEGRAANWWSKNGMVFRQFNHVVAVNSEIAGMMKRYGVNPERLSVIRPDSMDPTAIAAELPETLRSFFAAHDPVLLSVGLLEPEYDLPLQIEVIGDVRKQLPNAGLIMIGSGSLDRDLRERIAGHPEREHILLAGDVPHASTLRAIQSAAMLLRTTLYDGDAVSVREALFLGTPVIASDNGMRPAGVRLFEKQNAASLKRAITDAAGAPPTVRPAPAAFEQGLQEMLAVYRQLA